MIFMVCEGIFQSQLVSDHILKETKSQLAQKSSTGCEGRKCVMWAQCDHHTLLTSLRTLDSNTTVSSGKRTLRKACRDWTPSYLSIVLLTQSEPHAPRMKVVGDPRNRQQYNGRRSFQLSSCSPVEPSCSLGDRGTTGPLLL